MPRTRRQRLMRAAKHAGLAAAAGTLALLIASRWWSVNIVDAGRWDITTANGQVQIVDFAKFKGPKQFSIGVEPNRPRRLYAWFDWSTGDPRFPPYFIFPLWCPVAVMLAGSLLAWRLQGRNPAECRECGYDRTGLSPQTVCPECGSLPRPPRTHMKSANSDTSSKSGWNP